MATTTPAGRFKSGGTVDVTRNIVVDAVPPVRMSIQRSKQFVAIDRVSADFGDDDARRNVGKVSRSR